jgi:isopenicillin-N epimerase
MAESFRDYFLLDPSVTFLNHGSFGACPKPVFEEYQRWQRELEWQPVEFLGRRYHELLAESRSALGAYINADPDDVIYTDNATTGVNIVLRSLALDPGDEVITTDHEYGACDLTWQYLHERNGVVITRVPISLPVTTAADMVDSIWSRVTDRTKVLYLSHITSFSALVFPIEELCRRSRERGIITLIDGAHATSQIPLDMQAIGADFYTGNLHKWLCAPKGAAFLYVRPEHQEYVESMIVSWGWGEHPGQPNKQFLRRNQWQGTRDPASFLTVPAAIKFQAEHNWPERQQQCHELVCQARRRIASLVDLPVIAPEGEGWFVQMATCPVRTKDIRALKSNLYDEMKIEIPCMDWHGKQFVRVSIQAYNTQDDVDRLLEGLGRFL